MTRSRFPLRLYAHRGAAAEFPENTLRAFARAIEIGVDALEMDAHLSVDGEVFISHDPSGERMCGVPELIKESQSSDIRQWDAGAMFVDSASGHPFAKRGVHIPTLGEILSEFPETVINLDLKQEQPSMVNQVLAIIAEHRAEHRVVLASFSARTLLAVRRANYQGITALPRAELIAFVATPRWLFRRLPWRGDAAQLPDRIGAIDIGTRYIVNKCHAVGIRADYWTINDPTRALELLDAGADGIMTDDPATLIGPFTQWKKDHGCVS